MLMGLINVIRKEQNSSISRLLDFIAKSSSAGYIWLLIGNATAALLMMRQEYYILMTQQPLSMIPVSDALRSHHKKAELQMTK